MVFVGDFDTPMARHANDNFERINHIPVSRPFEKGIGHGSTCHDPDGGTFGKVALAWLDWQLKGSKEGAKLFQCAKCVLCINSQRIIRKRKINRAEESCQVEQRNRRPSSDLYPKAAGESVDVGSPGVFDAPQRL